jgi:ligand-binding SRPBCC domain-containing protein
MAEYEARLQISSPPEKVFDYLIRPANLVGMIPSDSGVTLLEVPDVLACGAVIKFEVAVAGIKLRIAHEVNELTPQKRLRHRQIEGPFKLWTQEHLLEPESDGRLLLINRVEFLPPGGLLGFVATQRKIAELLDVAFEHWHREIKKALDPAG